MACWAPVTLTPCMDPCELALSLVGLAFARSCRAFHLPNRNPPTIPILYLAIGALYMLPLPLPPADPVQFPKVAEHLTETPVVYPGSGSRWSLQGVAEVNVGVSAAAILGLLALGLLAVWWLLKTGWKLKSWTLCYGAGSQGKGKACA